MDTNESVPKVETIPHIERVVQIFIEYLENKWEYARLSLTEKGATASSSAVGFLVAIPFVFIVFLFLNLGLALWLSDKVGSLWSGFIIVAVVNLILLFILVSLLKPLIQKKITQLFLNSFGHDIK